MAKRRAETISILGTPDFNLRKVGTEEKKQTNKKEPKALKVFNCQRLGERQNF